MVKVLSTRCAVRRLGILTTMVASSGEGEQVFRRLNSLADRFLNVALDHVGSIPRDPTIGRSVMRGEPVVCAFPDAPASRAFEQIAQRVAEQGGGDDRQGAIRLFWRKLLRRSSTGRGEVAL
jgi:flagellar biosynthesis protein FlhG